jgi:hypothetical protein
MEASTTPDSESVAISALTGLSQILSAPVSSDAAPLSLGVGPSPTAPTSMSVQAQSQQLSASLLPPPPPRSPVNGGTSTPIHTRSRRNQEKQHKNARRNTGRTKSRRMRLTSQLRTRLLASPPKPPSSSSSSSLSTVAATARHQTRMHSHSQQQWGPNAWTHPAEPAIDEGESYNWQRLLADDLLDDDDDDDDESYKGDDSDGSMPRKKKKKNKKKNKKHDDDDDDDRIAMRTRAKLPLTRFEYDDLAGRSFNYLSMTPAEIDDVAFFEQFVTRTLAPSDHFGMPSSAEHGESIQEALNSAHATLSSSQVHKTVKSHSSSSAAAASAAAATDGEVPSPFDSLSAAGTSSIILAASPGADVDEDSDDEDFVPSTPTANEDLDIDSVSNVGDDAIFRRTRSQAPGQQELIQIPPPLQAHAPENDVYRRFLARMQMGDDTCASDTHDDGEDAPYEPGADEDEDEDEDVDEDVHEDVDEDEDEDGGDEKANINSNGRAALFALFGHHNRDSLEIPKAAIERHLVSLPTITKSFANIDVLEMGETLTRTPVGTKEDHGSFSRRQLSHVHALLQGHFRLLMQLMWCVSILLNNKHTANNSSKNGARSNSTKNKTRNLLSTVQLTNWMAKISDMVDECKALHDLVQRGSYLRIDALNINRPDIFHPPPPNTTSLKGLQQRFAPHFDHRLSRIWQATPSFSKLSQPKHRSFFSFYDDKLISRGLRVLSTPQRGGKPNWTALRSRFLPCFSVRQLRMHVGSSSRKFQSVSHNTNNSNNKKKKKKKRTKIIAKEKSAAASHCLTLVEAQTCMRAISVHGRDWPKICSSYLPSWKPRALSKAWDIHTSRNVRDALSNFHSQNNANGAPSIFSQAAPLAGRAAVSSTPSLTHSRSAAAISSFGTSAAAAAAPSSANDHHATTATLKRKPIQQPLLPQVPSPNPASQQSASMQPILSTRKRKRRRKLEINGMT